MLYRIVGFLLLCIMPFIIHSQSKTNSVESMIHFVDGDVLRGEIVLIEEGRLTLNSYGQTLIFDISEIERIVNLNGIQVSEDLLMESHFNINLGAHISFGNDFEYDLSLDYLHRLSNKNFLGLSLGYDSYFKFLSGVGRINGQFTSFSAVYEHLYSGSMRNYFSTIKLGYGISSGADQFNEGRTINGGVHSRVSMGYRFKTSGNLKIGIEGGIVYQYASGQDFDFNRTLVPFNHHFIKPTLRFVISIQ